MEINWGELGIWGAVETHRLNITLEKKLLMSPHVVHHLVVLPTIILPAPYLVI